MRSSKNNKKREESLFTSQQQEETVEYTSTSKPEVIDWHRTDAGYQERIRAAVSAYFNRRPHKGHTRPVSTRTGKGGDVGQPVPSKCSTTTREGTSKATIDKGGGSLKGDNPQLESSRVILNTKNTSFLDGSESTP